MMVARLWHGAVPIDKSDAYLNLMRTVALHNYKSVAGNRGAFILHRLADDRAHFVTLTFWESRDAIKAFAGEDIAQAKYYDFDGFFLLEREPTVQHYDIFESP